MDEEKDLTQSQKISVLLAEYDTLRTEVMAARASVVQAIGLAAAVTMGVIGFAFSTSFSGPRWVPWFIGTLALLYVCASCAWNEINTRKFTKRLRAIEEDINMRAKEPLLRWETEQGWGGVVTRRDHGA
jgi:hypothetical protein